MDVRADDVAVAAHNLGYVEVQTVHTVAQAVGLGNLLRVCLVSLHDQHLVGLAQILLHVGEPCRLVGFG